MRARKGVLKKYGKFVGMGLGIVVCIFVLLQYQNCGSQTNTNWSPVGPLGISYVVSLTPQNPTAVHGTPTTLQVSVLATAVESMIIRVGHFAAGGARIDDCTSNTYTPIQNPTIYCYPNFSSAGPVNLYVEVDDGNVGPSTPMILCTNASTPGCQGVFQLNVQ